MASIASPDLRPLAVAAAVRTLAMRVGADCIDHGEEILEPISKPSRRMTAGNPWLDSGQVVIVGVTSDPIPNNAILLHRC